MSSTEIEAQQKIAEAKLEQLGHMVSLDLTMFELGRRGVLGSRYNESLAAGQLVVRRAIFITLFDIADTAVSDNIIQTAWGWVKESKELQERVQRSNEPLNLGDEAHVNAQTLLVQRYLDQNLKP